jgi:ATP-dependent helicase HepA
MKWKQGMKVVHRAQRAWGVGIVIEVGEEGRRLAVRFAGRDGITVVSGRDAGLQEVPAETPIELPRAGPVEALTSGQPGPASAFGLRARVTRFEALRRADALGALLSSRVHVMPHQVGAAGRILQDRAPRFVLADEVGLGKTVEAGLVFAGMRQLGIAEKVLVIVPEHLAFQWLAELFHKFNALFTLLTEDRLLDAGPDPFAAHPLAIVSLEQLAADPELRAAAAGHAFDLVIVDEAHHLDDDALHDAVAPICRASFALLLLTATPVRLDAKEYFRLLALVEPIPSTTLEAFLARLARHESFAEVARELMAGGEPEEARQKLHRLAPDDEAFEAQAHGAEPLLAHLADRYSLSARLVRNRRAKVGAFTARVLRRVDVAAGKKLEAAVALLMGLAGKGEKALVFGHEPGGLRRLQAALADAGKEALLYDDSPGLEARDRLVARFRDPDGPPFLLSGESGGEGRNFQFCHHLVCFDLPDSPLTLEQRIGRLDRLGQHKPVEIHLLPEPGDESFLADLYEHEVGIFEEPVGGLDAVLASVPAELQALRGKPEGARQAFREALSGRVAEGRRAQHEGYDPLLDIRSAALPELASLVRRAFERLGEDPPATGAAEPGDDDIRAALASLSRWLEEELEDLCAEVGIRAGVEVDTDQNVAPFEAAFTLGAQLRIEALPGMTIPDEATTLLGSFWRETAVARDELEWFATGHRLVEALLGLVRDGDAGRSAALLAEWAPRTGALAARFEVVWPAPADLAPGARVPSRQAARYLDGSPLSFVVELSPPFKQRADLALKLEEAVSAGELKDARVEPAPVGVVESGRDSARRAAEQALESRKATALAALGTHSEAEEERLVAAGFGGGASREAVDAALSAVRAHRAATEAAIRSVKVGLDAVALLVP